MKAIANEKGYLGTRVVKPGEVFDVPQGTKKGKWFDLLPEKAEKTEKAEKGKAEKAPDLS